MADDKTKDEQSDPDATDDATATELNEDELDDDDDGASDDDDDDDDDDESDSPNTKRGKNDDDDDDELLDDDVEEDLDKILKDRLVAADDEAEADAQPVRGAGGEQLQPKQRDEQLCSSCFLLVRSNAPNCPIGDDDCPIFS
ncbi:MAG: hypothetical protein DRJ50_06980 [Actinobacteria bacterium]|nr:MAG: hypothetical protein DRJ50_06980 [Actinomycetota bacterium]